MSALHFFIVYILPSGGKKSWDDIERAFETSWPLAFHCLQSLFESMTIAFLTTRNE